MATGSNPLAGGFAVAAGQPTAEGTEPTLSVSEAVGLAKDRVKAMGSLLVLGEVTGFRGPNARSGHCYFQVKDESSSMDVIVWRNTYATLGFDLRNGMRVVLNGGFDVYAGTGKLSFIARTVLLEGEGLLRQQVEALARKLRAEGLMDDARKRRIAPFCMRVAVVTSLSGSVIDDVKRTLRRRNPIVELDVVGCAVQGPGAPHTIIRALEVAASARPEAILLVRGGGSFEDLMTFNDESLARAVAACPIPVITGIGHEPDNSICDMVADRRCSTPTAAAESVAPAIDQVAHVIDERRQRMGAALHQLCVRERGRSGALAERARVAVENRLAHERSMLEAKASRRCLENPMGFVEERATQLLQSEQRLMDAMPRQLGVHAGLVDEEARRLGAAIPHVVRKARQTVATQAAGLEHAGTRMLGPYTLALARAATALDALSPLKVLARGYAIASDEDGHVVTDAAQLSVGQSVGVRLRSGTFDARVESIATQAG